MEFIFLSALIIFIKWNYHLNSASKLSRYMYGNADLIIFCTVKYIKKQCVRVCSTLSNYFDGLFVWSFVRLYFLHHIYNIAYSYLLPEWLELIKNTQYMVKCCSGLYGICPISVTIKSACQICMTSMNYSRLCFHPLLLKSFFLFIRLIKCYIIASLLDIKGTFQLISYFLYSD